MGRLRYVTRTIVCLLGRRHTTEVILRFLSLTSSAWKLRLLLHCEDSLLVLVLNLGLAGRRLLAGLRCCLLLSAAWLLLKEGCSGFSTQAQPLLLLLLLNLLQSGLLLLALLK